MTLPTMNIGGLASGLDTNSIISSLVEVERIPVQQLETRRASYETKDKTWQDVNTRFSAIRTALSAIDSLSDFNKLASAVSSNEDAATVTVTGAATPGSVGFTVDQLAATHQVVSAGSFAGAGALVGAGDFTITLDGVDHVVTADAATTLTALAQQINALDVPVQASIVSVDGTNAKLVLSAEESGSSSVFTTSSTIATLSSTSIMQQGVDAEVTMGSGPGALTLSRSTNSITDLVDGVTIDLKATTTTAVVLNVTRDLDAAAGAVKTFVDAVNSAISLLDTSTAYNATSQTAGVLTGDSAARSLMFDLRSAISSAVNTGSSEYPIAASIGISLNREGTFDLDETKLREALDGNFADVTALLLEGGSSVDSRMSFSSAATSSVEGDYEVIVTQAATQATVQSNLFIPPWSGSTFQVVVGSETVDVTIAAFDPIETVVDAINDALGAAGVSTVTASQVDAGAFDRIQLDHSKYGAGASFQVIGDPFGMAGAYAGTDVAGTIGGQAATGAGRLLTASAGDPSGIAVTVSATAADVSGAGGSLSLGDLSYQKGLLGSVDRMLGLAEGTDGRIARARNLWQAQIDIVDDRIEVLEDRIDRKEAALIRQYAALETAMATLTAQASWLSAQLGAGMGTDG